MIPPTTPPGTPPSTPPSTPADVVPVVASGLTSVGVSSGTVNCPGFGAGCVTTTGGCTAADRGGGGGGGGGGGAGLSTANAIIVCMSGNVFVTRKSGMTTTKVSTTTCTTIEVTFEPGARSRSGRSIVPVIKSNIALGASCRKKGNRHTAADHGLITRNGPKKERLPEIRQPAWVKLRSSREFTHRAEWENKRLEQEVKRSGERVF